MRINELLKSTLATMRLHKRRTFLTMIGIIIGIAAVITIMSLGNGFRKQFMEEVVKDESGRTSQEFYFNLEGSLLEHEWATFKPFSDKNVQDIQLIPGVSEVVLDNEDQSNQTFYMDFKHRDQNINAGLQVVDQSQLEIITGRNLQFSDNQGARPYIIIEEMLASELFGQADRALSNSINMNNQEYTIVGVFRQPIPAESEGMMTITMGDNAQIYMPTQTYKRYNDSDMINFSMKVYFDKGADMKAISAEINTYLQEEGAGLEKGSYTYFDVSEMMEEVSNTLQTITYFISAVAAISLFIAGVGVMNMMYISVSERTKEIGIRRSMGATAKSIQWQFLLEGTSITLLGGIIGYLCGIGIATIAGNFLPFKPAIDIPTALVSVFISIMIGIVFSVFPARQAARKNVVEILR